MIFVKFFVILLAFFVFSQTASAQVHMDGVNHLALKAGFFDSFKSPGQFAGIYYSKVRNKRWWWRMGFQANWQDFSIDNTHVLSEKYLAHGSYFLTIGSLFRHTVYFNLGLGALAGYEKINGGQTRVNESIVLADSSKPVFGLNPEANMEIFLSSKMIFTLDYSKRILINSELSVWDDVYAAGLKFYIH